MKTHTVTTYSFDELSETAKEKALEQFRDINTDGGSQWFDCIYDDLHSLGQTIGVDIDLKKTYFRGFYSQGDGSSFTSTVDIVKMISGIDGEKWREYAPQESLHFWKFNVPSRVLKLLQSGKVSVNISSGPCGRYSGESSLFVDIDSEHEGQNKCGHIETWLENIAQTAKHNLKELNRWFYKSLKSHCEFLQSDEVVAETIVANEYEFLENGEQYY